MNRRTFLLALAVVLLAGTALRIAWLRSDPPTHASVGIVWHDEGAWVHNARNRALWGVWRTDEWNPVFVAPVFTALEYVAFREFGVGTWQARSVSVGAGLLAVIALALGLAAGMERRAALIGATLLATNYVFVMWNRAALMESTMTAFIVVAWAGYAAAGRRPAWGLVAGIAAVAAWFTKASAAFFVAALVMDAALVLGLYARPGFTEQAGFAPRTADERRGAWWVLAGIALAGLAVLIFFVIPHWTEYRFYNWQLSVTRKPSYHLRDLIDRASWLPVVQGFFTRMWIVVALSAAAIAGVAARWRTTRPGERLLALWVLMGLLELVVHDSGNERRYVMFLPALIALASTILSGRAPLLPLRTSSATWRARILATPLLLGLAYLVIGSVVRLGFLDEVLAGHLSTTVRLSAVLAVLATATILWQWRGLTTALARHTLRPAIAIALVAIGVVWNLYEFGDWARERSDSNYRASVEIGRLLPPGTLVQGKLANGLALENRIRPLFVGNHFGNYDDRLRRDDVRYILTYVSPALGYETPGGLIQEMLDRYPNRRVVATFDVDETPGPDRAALIDKFPDRSPESAAGSDRARH